jgi:3-oxoacyl-[acyl-carrier protein] reductase
MELKDKTAVITGSGRGLGKAIALMMAAKGANIVLNDIERSDCIDDTCSEMKTAGYNVIAVKGDVRNSDDVKKLFTSAQDTFGSVDILVNNAGVTKDGLMIRMSEDDWDLVLDINLKGAFICTKTCARYMIRQKSGVIVNIASVAGVMGNPGQANYSSSKAGLIGLTKTTAKELSSKNIRCNAVAPGIIRSRMTDILSDKVKQDYLDSIPLGRFGEPEDVAKVVCFLASDESSYVTGQVVNIDGGLVI